MKRTRRDLLEEYQGGDFTRQMHLYLQYRELRSEFMKTDHSELRFRKPAGIPQSKRFPRFLTCTLGKACSFPGRV